MSPGEWNDVELSKLMDTVEKIISERHLAAQGSNGIGPTRHEKSITAARKAIGKPRDVLVDSLVVEVEEPTKQRGGKRAIVFCVGCLKKTVGRDPNRIKQHGKDCNVCNFSNSSIYLKLIFEYYRS